MKTAWIFEKGSADPNTKKKLARQSIVLHCLFQVPDHDVRSDIQLRLCKKCIVLPVIHAYAVGVLMDIYPDINYTVLRE